MDPIEYLKPLDEFSDNLILDIYKHTGDSSFLFYLFIKKNKLSIYGIEDILKGFGINGKLVILFIYRCQLALRGDMEAYKFYSSLDTKERSLKEYELIGQKESDEIFDLDMDIESDNSYFDIYNWNKFINYGMIDSYVEEDFLSKEEVDEIRKENEYIKKKNDEKFRNDDDDIEEYDF